MFTRTITLATLAALAALVLIIGSRPVAAQFDDRIRGVTWQDANCDGIRQESEALLPMIRLTLRWAGSNGVIDSTDRDIEQAQSLTGAYAFSIPAAGEPYFISVRSEDKPAKMKPAPFRQGGDPTSDNDMTTDLLPGTPLWATPVFTMPADGSMVTGLDIGLCVMSMPFGSYLPAVSR